MSEYLGHCDVETHPHKDTPGIATHIHKKQLEDTKTEVRQLRAENEALRAQLGSQAWRRTTPEGDLLVGLAEAFDIAHSFADPAPSAQVTDHTKTGRQKPESGEPKAGNKAARGALKALLRGVESQLETFHNRRENDWHSLHKLREVQQECAYCAEGFVPMRSTATYCSDVCRTRANRSLANAKRNNIDFRDPAESRS